MLRILRQQLLAATWIGLLFDSREWNVNGYVLAKFNYGYSLNIDQQKGIGLARQIKVCKALKSRFYRIVVPIYITLWIRKVYMGWEYNIHSLGTVILEF